MTMPAEMRQHSTRAWMGPLRRSALAGLVASALLLTGLPSDAQPTSREALSVIDLQANSQASPLGLDDRTPRLEWKLQTRARGTQQVERQLRAAGSAADLQHGRRLLWDSGRVHSTQPSARYAGKALVSSQRVFWSVRVWDANGTASAWAPATWFETGLLRPSDWKARWIAGPERDMTIPTAATGAADDAAILDAGEFCRPPNGVPDSYAATPDSNDTLQQATVIWTALPATTVASNQGACRAVRPAPMLRTAFSIRKPISRARLYSTGLGYNDMTVNGRGVSAAVLDPLFTDYSKTVSYTTLDVTRLLRRGENVLASTLGSGQFDNAAESRDWGWERAQWRATPRLRAQLVITYADGTTQTVVSDASWRVSVEGPTRYDNFYLGETFDARRAIAGWDKPGFHAGQGWSPARTVSGPKGAVTAQTSPAMTVVARRQPASSTALVPGVTVVDAGRILTGWATLAVRGASAGTPIELYYGERKAANGNVANANGLINGQIQTDYYVARGAAREIWAPRFSYKGFQYLRISGPNGVPLPSGVTVEVVEINEVRTPLPATASFSTSNPTINRIYQNSTWAIRNNIHGIITDTPTQEKNGWTGDAQLSAGAASTIYDTRTLYQSLFRCMRDEQRSTGEVPLLCPTNDNYGHVGQTFKPAADGGATPIWDAFWFVLPWENYMRYGDSRGLTQVYPSMRRYLDKWIPIWAGRDGDPYPHTLTSGLGDWDPPSQTETVIPLSSTAYYAYLASITAHAAAALGRRQEATHYRNLFTAIRRDFNAKFLASDGTYRDTPDSPFTHTAQLLPLAFDLVPKQLARPLAAKLAQDIQAKGGHAFVGIAGARWLLPVLCDFGYVDVAEQVLSNTSYPGWGYWTDTLKWSSLGEYWDGASRSRNHHMFASVVQGMFENFAGISPATPGYERVQIRPHVPRALAALSSSVQTVRGRVSLDWQRAKDGALRFKVTVPATSVADLYLPSSDSRRVTESGRGPVPAAEAEGVRVLDSNGTSVHLRLGSGDYVFTIPATVVTHP